MHGRNLDLNMTSCHSIPLASKTAFIDSFTCFLSSPFFFIISEKSPLKKKISIKPSEKLVKYSEMIHLL